MIHGLNGTSYFSETKSRSILGGNCTLRSGSADLSKKPKSSINNIPLRTEWQVLHHVVESAAETQLGALFHNEKIAIPMRTTLKELGHQQPPIPIEIDKSTVLGIVKFTDKKKKLKSMDMRLY